MFKPLTANLPKEPVEVDEPLIVDALANSIFEFESIESAVLNVEPLKVLKKNAPWLEPFLLVINVLAPECWIVKVWLVPSESCINKSAVEALRCNKLVGLSVPMPTLLVESS